MTAPPLDTISLDEMARYVQAEVDEEDIELVRFANANPAVAMQMLRAAHAQMVSNMAHAHAECEQANLDSMTMEMLKDSMFGRQLTALKQLESYNNSAPSEAVSTRRPPRVRN